MASLGLVSLAGGIAQLVVRGAQRRDPQRYYTREEIDASIDAYNSLYRSQCGETLSERRHAPPEESADQSTTYAPVELRVSPVGASLVVHF